MWSYSKWLKVVVCIVMMLIRANGQQVPITIVHDAVAKGGVCLDGSPPAYHFDKGFEAGLDNWLIHLEGGGWCNDVTTCLERKQTNLGSSNLMSTIYTFSAILSNDAKFNPDFYNWNRVLVRYCDGSSYTGDVEAVDPNAQVHYRGARVWRAIMDELLAKGMKNARNAVISGCSAGGLSVVLQCDNFHSVLPSGAKVKCVSDAGFVLNVKDVSGAPRIQDFFAQIVDTHGSAKNLPQSCTSKLNPHLCMFPQYVAREMRTPLFILNAAYDIAQVKFAFVPRVADPEGKWEVCKANIAQCSESQLQALQGLRKDLLAALSSLGDSPPIGLFINSCYTHCQSEKQATWLSDNSPMVYNTTISKAVGDWFHDRKPFQRIDCPYPCDKTCPR